MIKTLRWVLPIVYLAVLFIPGFHFFYSRGGFGFLTGTSATEFASLIFPLFGLYAFTLVWAQLMIGSNMLPLEKVFPNILKFHVAQGIFVLLFALTHPSLLYLSGIDKGPYPVSFRAIGSLTLLLILITVTTALLRKIKFMQNKWHILHIANYIVFLSAWIHSWLIGSDITTSHLKWAWLVAGLLAIISAIAKLSRYLKLKKTINA